ncbi:DUF3297 family protein [Vibrio chagasii]|nr:DUF3297 family protein [Vibrio chagasii]
MSEGWSEDSFSKALDRFGQPMLITLQGRHCRSLLHRRIIDGCS